MKLSNLQWCINRFDYSKGQTMSTFHADAPPSTRYAAAGRLLLLVVALTAFNIWNGWPFWSIVGMALLGLAMVAFSFVARSRWGDRLDILAEMINVHKQGEKRLCIQVPDITSLTVKADSIAVLWRHAGKKSFLVLGSECFSEPTWVQLSAAMRKLR